MDIRISFGNIEISLYIEKQCVLKPYIMHHSWRIKEQISYWNYEKFFSLSWLWFEIEFIVL